MDTDMITKEDIDRLLDFLPLFEDPESLVLGWPETAQKGDEEAAVLKSAVYAEEVRQFFWLAGMPKWTDYQYISKKCIDKIGDDAFIAQASIEEIKTLLTHCVRGERFCDGFWARLIEKRTIVKILRRLERFRENL